jgi:hypothetical protein
MKQSLKIIWSITISAIIGSLQADNRIIVYLQHAPDKVISQAEQEAKDTSLATKIASLETKTPGKLGYSMFKNSLRAYFKPQLSGFVGIYGGYLDISDPNGLLSYPLRHTTPKIYVAITPTIHMVDIKGNTFSHREFVLGEPVSYYSFEMKEDEKKNSFWDVKEIPVPADKKINPITLVILSNPKNIYIPKGQFIITPNVQLVLPSIYVVGRNNNDAALLNMLDIRRYFEPIKFEEKKATDLSFQKMITNL